MKLHEKYFHWLMIGIVSGLLIPVGALHVRPAYAQGMSQIINLIKNKAGFDYGNNSGFVFTKETPSYTAYAGDRATAGGHRIMLALGADQIEFSFLSAELAASPSAQIASPSVVLAPSDQLTLDRAEQILDRQATQSGTSVTTINETGITTDERLVLASASGILSASDSADLTPEQKDFLLLVQIKSKKLTADSLTITDDILGAINEAKQVLSLAKLEENEKDRRVVFHSVASGIDMSYGLNEYGITQDIQIADSAAGTNTFRFSLDTHGMTYKDVGAGVWYFSDAAGYVMRLTKGWAMDAKGKFTNDVGVSIIRKGVKNELVITVPADWLNDSTRSYPVTVHLGLEIVPDLRDGRPGATEKRVRRVEIPVASESASVTPTATPSARLPAQERSDGGQATPIIEMAPVPITTDSGTLESTSSASPSGSLQL